MAGVDDGERLDEACVVRRDALDQLEQHSVLDDDARVQLQQGSAS